MRRRGFTALEVLVASSISVVVIAGAFALMGFLDRMSRIHERRFDDVVEMGLLHETIRRALQTLVAEAPPNTLPGNPPSESDPNNLNGEDAETKEQQAAETQEQLSERASRRNQPERPPALPRFLLAPQIPGQNGPEAPRRLEVVVLEQPAPVETALSPTVRGAFELVPRIDGLALQWRSIDPPGLPVLLATRIREIRWTALARDFIEERFKASSGAWRVDMAGRVPKEFPKAVRLEIVTMTGTRIDWLFEPAITTGPEP